MLKLFKKKLNNYFTGITILLEDLFSHAKCALNMHVGATQALSHSSALWNYCERCVLHYISTSHYPIRTYIYIYIKAHATHFKIKCMSQALGLTIISLRL